MEPLNAVVQEGTKGDPYLNRRVQQLNYASKLYGIGSRSILEPYLQELSILLFNMKKTPEGLALYRSKLDALLQKAFNALYWYVDKGVHSFAPEIINIYSEVSDVSYTPPSDVNSIVSGWVEKEKFGKTLAERFDKRKTKAFADILSITSGAFLLSNAISQKSLENDLEDYFMFSGTSYPSMYGSLSLYGKTVCNAEIGSARQFLAQHTLKHWDVLYVYWRLSGAHKWQGGGEICEQYALEPHITNSQGYSPFGLYDIKELPAFPHPGCFCHIEPVF